MLRKLLPHAALILSAMYLVFFCIDRVNSAMLFINNPITKGLLLALCTVCAVESVWLIRDDRRAQRRRAARRAKKRALPASGAADARRR